MFTYTWQRTQFVNMPNMFENGMLRRSERPTMEQCTYFVIVIKCYYEDEIKQDVMGGPRNEQAQKS
jgi:hypothetical protein